MKKAIIILAVIFLPTNSFAYDVLTPNILSIDEKVKDANVFLQDQYKLQCVEQARRQEAEKEIAYNEFNKNSNDRRAQFRLESSLRKITENYADSVSQCEKIKNDLYNQPKFILGVLSPNLSCGQDYILRGNQCITHTDNCKAYFGQNVTGSKKLGDVYVSECTCNTGYKFDGKQCVMPQVKGASTSNEALIAQLQTQIAFLIKQIALLKK